jgi:dipeptidyl-peptidase 4
LALLALRSDPGVHSSSSSPVRGRFVNVRNSVFLPGILILFLLPNYTQAQTRKLTIDAIYQPGGLGGRGPENLEWSPDGTKLSYVQRDPTGESGELWYMDAATGEKKVLVSAGKLASLAPDVNKIKNEREKERLTRYHVAEYLWSPDSKHLLFNAQGQLWLFDTNTQTAVQFTSAPEPSESPEFSPDGKHVAYVRKHNLFVRPADGKDETQLTHDDDDNLLNGEIDWVYAEELAVRSNYFWSPDGKDIVFLHMDETKVPTYPIANRLQTHSTVYQQKYPQPGDPNPVVKLGVVNIDKGKVRWVSLTSDEDTYVPRFGWAEQGVIWAELLNRRQDKAQLFLIDAKSGKSRIVLTEDDPDSWIDFDHVEPRFLKSPQFIWPSWRDGNMHMYLYSFDQQKPLAADAKLQQQLEQGDYEVLGIAGADESTKTVFFEANKDDPRQEHVYSVQLDGSGMRDLTPEVGMHHANFSDDGKHYSDSFNGPQTPQILSLCAVGGSCQPVWKANNEVAEYGLRAPEYLEFKADDGTTLYGRLLLPPEGTGSLGKIPVIINIYGGPAGQMVLKSLPNPFDEILARKGFAVFAVDNRGTPGRDRKFQTTIRHEFGAIELKDQLTAFDQLLSRYPQLDPNRIAIWGWSNGGSMTLYSLTHSDRFRAGVAVAPVTNALNYDSIYMERYLGLPKEVMSGYDDSNVTKAAGNLHGALLLVHGTGDDNVHFSNSVQMVDELIKAGKQFQFMMYPNKTHGISGSDARVHLFTMIEDHFERELKK